MAKFRTRARTVDMLGRQQISGIPTAISELFKNAHDAYADHVEVDFYRSDRLFVLRDDGLGMTRDDFETRWLTLGTESKLGKESGMSLPPRVLGKAPRPVLGEKGIGRLAIAAVGEQVIIVSRAKRDEVLQDTVVAYIHWRIFEQPGIDLDEIQIPVRSYPDGILPDESEIADMLTEFSANLDKLKYLSDSERARFEADFNKTRLNLSEVDSLIPRMSLTGEGHGTHFIISPASPLLDADIDRSTKEEASPLEKALLGFTNTMTPDHLQPDIKTAFRDYPEDGPERNIIAEGEFFTIKEFLSTDHHFEGEFDEYGQFNGHISIYRESGIPYSIEWKGAKGRKTACGPFKVNVAYLQGSLNQTTLVGEDFNLLFQKAERLGGLYIYKNGIRILPYGDTNYDWLEIEKRRTKKASRYFFSHRRMFGTVEIDQSQNKELSEKAGREGFRENKAYREFREILKNFFLNLAAEFFNESGVYSGEFLERRAELEQAELLRKKREHQSSQKRKVFATQLEDFDQAYRSNEPEREAFELTAKFQNELEHAASITDERRAAYEFLSIESNARQRLRVLEEKYRIPRPKGFAVTAALERDYNDYLHNHQKLQQTTFSVFRGLVEGEVSQAAQRARVELDRRMRVEYSLRELATQAESVGRSERKNTITVLESLDDLIKDKVKESVVQINEEVRNVLMEFNTIDFTDLEETAVFDIRDRLESRIILVKDRKQELLRAIRTQLENINLSDEAVQQVDQLDALEQRVLTLEEQDDEQMRLSQLGMAIEIINHEFESTVRGIRDSLRRLKGWADLNESLDGVYQDLRISFEHLDGYLTLFTPLQRRLYRRAAPISGPEIFEYITNLFRTRFERHDIQLVATPQFNKQKITGYLSSFLPVFVNLVDNAIYWSKDRPIPRTIEFHAEGDDFLVSNNGTELIGSRFDSVFQPGVSYKPGGRGLGLAISREALEKAGYSIQIDDQARPNMVITFRISPKQ
ncbi:ATP-binding protein [Hymenobacter lapidiphilus]|uniref:ATP-binding protein n=1 Tax=Hymenobacter lapidiphilus TaxID=2608003 RepID=A0A7Y7PSA7_9BACT|nr:ATP-binding protein [Hymenobacter lapidiphilus]NVO33098.1 ATP-binding protein [Hymenobacter lapidiphilus]